MGCWGDEKLWWAYGLVYCRSCWDLLTLYCNSWFHQQQQDCSPPKEFISSIRVRKVLASHPVWNIYSTTHSVSGVATSTVDCIILLPTRATYVSWYQLCNSITLLYGVHSRTLTLLDSATFGLVCPLYLPPRRRVRDENPCLCNNVDTVLYNVCTQAVPHAKQDWTPSRI